MWLCGIILIMLGSCGNNKTNTLHSLWKISMRWHAKQTTQGASLTRAYNLYKGRKHAGMTSFAAKLDTTRISPTLHFQHVCLLITFWTQTQRTFARQAWPGTEAHMVITNVLVITKLHSVFVGHSDFARFCGYYREADKSIMSKQSCACITTYSLLQLQFPNASFGIIHLARRTHKLCDFLTVPSQDAHKPLPQYAVRIWPFWNQIRCNMFCITNFTTCAVWRYLLFSLTHIKVIKHSKRPRMSTV